MALAIVKSSERLIIKAALLMITPAPTLPAPDPEPRRKVPALMVVVPLKVLSAVSVKVPVPICNKAPEPLITPEYVSASDLLNQTCDLFEVTTLPSKLPLVALLPICKTPASNSVPPV